jgi:hypothetical protein
MKAYKRRGIAANCHNQQLVMLQEVFGGARLGDGGGRLSWGMEERAALWGFGEELGERWR